MESICPRLGEVAFGNQRLFIPDLLGCAYVIIGAPSAVVTSVLLHVSGPLQLAYQARKHGQPTSHIHGAVGPSLNVRVVGQRSPKEAYIGRDDPQCVHKFFYFVFSMLNLQEGVEPPVFFRRCRS
jgi:hypothetical protein